MATFDMYQVKYVEELDAENKRLREALMSVYTHCLVGQVGVTVDGTEDGTPWFPPDYELWHTEVRKIMKQALKGDE